MKYLKVYTDFAEAMEALSDAERGRLFMSMLQYASTGEAGALAADAEQEKALDNAIDITPPESIDAETGEIKE